MFAVSSPSQDREKRSLGLSPKLALTAAPFGHSGGNAELRHYERRKVRHGRGRLHLARLHYER
eukprot:1551522-Pyramimonas_sp.AAC.1